MQPLLTYLPLSDQIRRVALTKEEYTKGCRAFQSLTESMTLVNRAFAAQARSSDEIWTEVALRAMFEASNLSSYTETVYVDGEYVRRFRSHYIRPYGMLTAGIMHQCKAVGPLVMGHSWLYLFKYAYWPQLARLPSFVEGRVLKTIPREWLSDEYVRRRATRLGIQFLPGYYSYEDYEDVVYSARSIYDRLEDDILYGVVDYDVHLTVDLQCFQLWPVRRLSLESCFDETYRSHVKFSALVNDSNGPKPSLVDNYVDDTELDEHFATVAAAAVLDAHARMPDDYDSDYSSDGDDVPSSLKIALDEVVPEKLRTPLLTRAIASLGSAYCWAELLPEHLRDYYVRRNLGVITGQILRTMPLDLSRRYDAYLISPGFWHVVVCSTGSTAADVVKKIGIDHYVGYDPGEEKVTDGFRRSSALDAWPLFDDPMLYSFDLERAAAKRVSDDVVDFSFIVVAALLGVAAVILCVTYLIPWLLTLFFLDVSLLLMFTKDLSGADGIFDRLPIPVWVWQDLRWVFIFWVAEMLVSMMLLYLHMSVIWLAISLVVK